MDGGSLVLPSEILLARTNQETNQPRHAKETRLQKLTESEGRLGAHEETQGWGLPSPDFSKLWGSMLSTNCPTNLKDKPQNIRI